MTPQGETDTDVAHEINNHLTVVDLTLDTIRERLVACARTGEHEAACARLTALVTMAIDSMAHVRALTEGSAIATTDASPRLRRPPSRPRPGV